ncbi:hypothetical protein ORI20_13825 [Mycobacterium sp. CVI_P3]|uniref:Uncharacterized protein n=1 Tax=Mycobacterium pinniadriaticum TaxID=2994102 RepID=A0ABT3SEH1_9MYCO|nr:hypothetical protein [Mycobacterium pinniadriaticum]MCX2931358.1 hypothetical protein [Mycobacterium pinniadriaticum]MCX2937782.1 hypothetical protein [Mycobacterium pinniadriaticum]
MKNAIIPVPGEIVDLVDEYVRKQLDDAKQYDNRSPLDESGIFSLHRLASEIYAAGFEAGVRVEGARASGVDQRRRDGVST